MSRQLPYEAGGFLRGSVSRGRGDLRRGVSDIVETRTWRVQLPDVSVSPLHTNDRVLLILATFAVTKAAQVNARPCRLIGFLPNGEIPRRRTIRSHDLLHSKVEFGARCATMK